MTTKTHILSDELSAIDWCYEQGWTDGLPVVPPARERVERFLMAAGRPPEEIVARHPATGRECSVQSAAVNAVMSGCLPQYFPTVLAALEGLNEDAYNFHGSTASTGGSAPVVIISGDIRDEIGMNASVNVFGPGNRANATIGRAIRLVIMNIFQMIPGISDRSTTAGPASTAAASPRTSSIAPGNRCMNRSASRPRFRPPRSLPGPVSTTSRITTPATPSCCSTPSPTPWHRWAPSRTANRSS